MSEIVLVGDRGMITASNEEKLAALPEAEGLKIISRYKSLSRVHPWSLFNKFIAPHLA